MEPKYTRMLRLFHIFILLMIDSYYFQASDSVALAMKHIISIYEDALGQMINLQKSEIYYNRNVSTNVKNLVANNLGYATSVRY